MDEMLEKHCPQINNVPKQELHNLVEGMSPEVVPKKVYDAISELKENRKNFTVLVCSTGSVATIKLPEILSQLHSAIDNVKLEVILTEKAKHFCTVDSVSVPGVNIYSDSEWNVDKTPFLPDELAQRANILLIAPLDANTLAKIANGLCDNLLTTVVRIWDFNKTAVCCPAMNTQMWIHPITDVHIKQLESLGFIIIPPITKKLACGDFGVGAMAEPHSIVTKVKRFADFDLNKDTYEASILLQDKCTGDATTRLAAQCDNEG